MLTTADEANQQMVDRLIAEGDLWSRPLIAAFRATPRHRFLDRIFQYQRKRERWREIPLLEPGAEQLRLIYSDRALITHVSPADRAGPGVPTSSSSQPSLMAQMLEDLQLHAGLRTLEVGSGTGYNAALLALLAAPAAITSVDVDRDILLEAWEHLRSFADRRVDFRHADGREGYAEAAPYDRIMVTAATPDLEPAWLEQLAEGGLLLAPLVLAPGLAFVVRGTVTKGEFRGRLTRAAYFMPLHAEGEAGEPGECPWPQSPELRTVPAPWAGWFERRRIHGNWLEFVQALVFFGLVRGLEVQQRSGAGGEAEYGINDLGSICWFGSGQWQVNGDSAHDLACDLYRAWLEAGGPRPTEFHLRAYPRHGPGVVQARGFLRRGSRCDQFWEPMDPIERIMPLS